MKCVHTEHCCAKHGCKYGDEDCPVWIGTKPQSYPCELCDREKPPRVFGVKEPDEKTKNMKDVWEACCKANVSIPKEVHDYFKDSWPDKVFLVNLDKYYEECEGGFEIDISKLPKDILKLRIKY